MTKILKICSRNTQKSAKKRLKTKLKNEKINNNVYLCIKKKNQNIIQIRPILGYKIKVKKFKKKNRKKKYKTNHKLRLLKFNQSIKEC